MVLTKTMDVLPFIVIDREMRLLHQYRLSDENVDEKLTRSLRRGDRMIFKDFCGENFDITEPHCNLFELSDFEPFRYAFLEKTVSRGTVVNIVYLAAETAEFHQLMSPSSRYYRNLTGQCIHGILSAKYHGNASYLTPTSLLALSKLPHLCDDLLNDKPSSNYCDILTLTQRITESARKMPFLRRTKIDIVCPNKNGTAVTEFPITSYIYVFASLIHIFSALADDHKIRVELSTVRMRANVSFSANVSRFRNMQCDAGSLAELARFVPSMSNIAEVAAFAAYNENMSTSVMYDSESNTVSTTVALGAAVTVGPSFHYRDPYTGAGDIFKEFSDFISLLMDGAA